MKAILISAFGEPRDVLRFEDVPEPAPPREREVLVQVLASPLNLHDLYFARGAFPVLPKTPGPLGNEGVGRVIARGAGVRNVDVGDLVLLPVFSWMWRERMVVPADGLFALPEADLHQLAMLGINPPTAALILSDYAKLEPGDWVVQNAANSGVGRAVIAIAKARGLRTINIVRRADVVDELRAAGGDVVLVDGEDIRSAVARAAGGGRLALGIDAVGGAGTGLITSVVSPHAVVVAYAVLSGPTMAIPAQDPIFKEVVLRGFFLGNAGSAAAAPAAIRDILPLVVSGALHTPISGVYPPSAITDAVTHAERGGKVMLDFQ